jgi:hypothetical protein
LRTLEEALRAAGAPHVANADVRPLAAQVAAFGFHLARLDIRQNSAYHDRAIGCLLVAAGAERTDYETWTEDQKLAFLDCELRTLRPFTGAHMQLSGEAQASVMLMRTVREHMLQYGADGIGPFIVSMTCGLSDLLGVFLLAREGGLLTNSAAGAVCELMIAVMRRAVRKNPSSVLRVGGGGGAEPCGLSRPDRDGRLPQLLPAGDADRRARIQPDRLAPAAADRPNLARRPARHSLGVQLGASPLPSAGLSPGCGASGRRSERRSALQYPTGRLSPISCRTWRRAC